ncbi:FAD/NAD(P)-binding protein [Amycolatopsis nigrescens]|uniref:FAD/NAD(P)-binding protein n=1 Tax=Amycolatopsis nigrescens TaxID=381445 RepID=UPI00068862A3|nr:FAD/NAD(P)-binding protein [Amycolatopsis nigrescens]
MPSDCLRIGVIGAGPRGLSVLERLCANAAAGGGRARRVVVQVVDPCVGGRVWRTTQPSSLLMNTVACQVTMFTDESVECAGPKAPGPSLYEWARLVARNGSPGDHPAEVLAEAARLGPDSYPSRVFYGHYLGWTLRRTIRAAPPRVRIRIIERTAVALADEPGGTQVVTLDDGVELTGLDVVVLAQGHLPMPPGEEERRLQAFSAEHGLWYCPPGNPADADLDALAAGGKVALRGMGLNFFDYLALLTVDRGGRFTRRAGRLGYRPSGREPLLYAGSRRGVPHHSRGENQKGAKGRHEPRFLTASAVWRLQSRQVGGGRPEFRRDVWPLIAAEVETVYYHTLIGERLGSAAAGLFLRQRLAGMPDLLTMFGVEEREKWDWDRIARPWGTRGFGSSGEFQDWLLGYLRADVAEAKRGNVGSPLKAALDVLRDLRNEIRLVVDHGGLPGDSYRDELTSWYTPLNAFVSIGPPVSRTEEMIALIEAGVLRVLGPGMRVEPAPGGTGFVVSSASVPGSAVEVPALIEARLPVTDVRTTTDPLLRYLLASGQARPYEIPDGAGVPVETGGLFVTARPYHVVDARNRPHPRRFAFGVPTETVHWVTAAGIRPGVNSVILADADAVARAALSGGFRAAPNFSGRTVSRVGSQTFEPTLQPAEDRQ